jgi:AraC-like DNA-binding protein
MPLVPQYEEIQPSPRLDRYVECYWSRSDAIGTRGHVLPDGCVDILFTSQNGKPTNLTIVGLMTRPQTFEIPAGQSFFGVRFRPGMASAFVREAAQLSDKVEPLDDFFGADAHRLFEQLAESRTPTEMVQRMDRFLRPLEPPDRAQKAIEYLSADLSVDRLAVESGMSVRQLRRVCIERAGVSPKYLSRILRFRRASEYIGRAARQGAQPAWADVAAACGYFDQAHLIREFQEFTGSTPGRYLQSLPNRSL